jgi:hypothetical protein
LFIFSVILQRKSISRCYIDICGKCRFSNWIFGQNFKEKKTRQIVEPFSRRASYLFCTVLIFWAVNFFASALLCCYYIESLQGEFKWYILIIWIPWENKKNNTYFWVWQVFSSFFQAFQYRKNKNFVNNSQESKQKSRGKPYQCSA